MHLAVRAEFLCEAAGEAGGAVATLAGTSPRLLSSEWPKEP